MKGIILAGGTGSRLWPLTKVTNKHLLPIYNKPMIYYPIEFLRDSGIKNIMIVLGGNSVGDFINLLGDGSGLGVSLTYKHQAKPDGIAGALKLCRDFCGEDYFTVCLGDNIFEKPIENLGKWGYGCSPRPLSKIFIHPTDKPSSFGVPTLSENKVIKITEKPKNPDSNYAVTGLYQYDKYIWSMIDSLTPSLRGELEITDINNWYISQEGLKAKTLEGFWHDAGSIESLFLCSELIRNANKK